MKPRRGTVLVTGGRDPRKSFDFVNCTRAWPT